MRAWRLWRRRIGAASIGGGTNLLGGLGAAGQIIFTAIMYRMVMVAFLQTQPLSLMKMLNRLKMMKYFVIPLIAAVSIASQTHAADSRLYKSEPETIFCTSKISAKNFQNYMRQKDVVAAGSVIKSGSCSIVNPSVELFIDSEDDGVVGVRRKGLTSVVWTFRHMIR